MLERLDHMYFSVTRARIEVYSNWPHNLTTQAIISILSCQWPNVILFFALRHFPM